MICLVTGADGFIGTYLTGELQRRKVDVRPLPYNPGSGGIDITDHDAVCGYMSEMAPDVVFHLAAISGPMLESGRPHVVASVNCVGTINVLDGALRSGVSRFIYCSSVSGYDGGTSVEPFPLSVYGATKRFGELSLRIFHDLGIAVAVSARIGAVYGKGRKTLALLERMVKQAESERHVSYAENCVEPLIHVADAARALAELASVDKAPTTCDLVSEILEERVLAETVCDAFGLQSSAAVADREAGAHYPWLFQTSDLAALLRGKAPIRLRESLAGLVQKGR